MPDSVVIDFSDPDHLQSAIRAADVTLHLTQPGDFRAKLTRIDLHRLWMQQCRTSLPLIAHSACPVARSAFFFLADPLCPPLRVAGMEVTGANIVAESPWIESHTRLPANSAWSSMSLTVDDLATAGRALLGYDLTPRDGARLLQPPEHLMARLRGLHGAACHLADSTPDILAHPEVARTVEQELIRTMIACLSEGAAVKIVRSTRRVMQRFEDAPVAHDSDPLYLTELCAELGVSDRTLRLHCQQHLGMSPQQYLWLRRMNMARRALTSADATLATVSSVATEYGFGELGRFSVRYRDLFGESPSVTLRRAPA
jgi:AraC-like DNA-binding protein